jgi:hypothetical protein
LNDRVTVQAQAHPHTAVLVGIIALIILVILVLFWTMRAHPSRMIIAAGCIVTIFVLLGLLITWHAIARQRNAGNWAEELTRLGFPLELPSVPGYFPMGGYILDDGSLEIDMGRDEKARTAYHASVLTVILYRTRNSEGAAVLRGCAPAGDIKPQYSCQVKGAGLWMVTAPGMSYNEALADKQDMIIVAHENGATVPGSVLLQAVTLLRPATAAQIASLPSTNAG